MMSATCGHGDQARSCAGASRPARLCGEALAMAQLRHQRDLGTETPNENNQPRPVLRGLLSQMISTAQEPSRPAYRETRTTAAAAPASTETQASRNGRRPPVAVHGVSVTGGRVCIPDMGPQVVPSCSFTMAPETRRAAVRWVKEESRFRLCSSTRSDDS